jgi:hypothetical protein
VLAGGRDLRRDQGPGLRDQQLVFHEDQCSRSGTGKPAYKGRYGLGKGSASKSEA